MKKRILSFLLALVMTASMLPVIAVGAAGESYQPPEITSDYFYNQLNDRAKAIYDKLLTEFTDPSTKEQYYEGTQPIDLIDVTYGSGSEHPGRPIITETDIANYRNGNKDIFNDFCAAKDALDLDHSELWYIDSGYLTFRVTHSSVESNLSKGYHVLIGPGRGKTYLLGGLTAEEVCGTEGSIKAMDDKINSTIGSMVNNAISALNKATSDVEYSTQDQIAYLATHIHDQITKGIHYRYEIECDKPEDAKFIRTIYGMQTHEGVCEAYARTLQVCLTKLGIKCVLIHGVQSKGTPEDHMWNAVNIPEGETDHWYVIDATWDDPLTAKWDGTRDLDFKGGEDGKETNTYLLVGQNVVGEYWNPSGYVSTGNFEFKYPTIETASYSGATVLESSDGLKVQYSAGGSQEDNIPAGVFAVTYQGMDAKQARDKGLYFIIKMYDYHPDGTADVMDEWYYVDATLIAASNTPYFGDYDGTLRFSTATCEYVEIAVTTREPEGRETWELDPSSGRNALTNDWRVGYFRGDESEIIAQSGMLYNVNSKYEAPPYVLTQFPAPNGNVTAGYQYRYRVTYDDLLYHILPTDTNGRNGIAAVDNFSDNYEQAREQNVQVRYYTEQEDLHEYHAVKAHQVVGDLPFDNNRDGVVDMSDNNYVNFQWIYASDPDEIGNWGFTECPNTAYHENGHKDCDVNQGCPIVGVEFNFKASDQWIDDVTRYTFVMEGLVGSRSSKYPNNFSSIAVVPGLCPACYRSQGIDWNLWGQPTLLDAPENLNLEAMAKAGGTDKDTLEKLNDEMFHDDINGRLMLVVEDKSKGAGNREDYEQIESALESSELYKSEVVEGDKILGSSVFEINFNRICPMVKLKPNQGESLRVQVGYPAGVTYEALGSGTVELKAYHFTRCAPENQSAHPCSNADNPGHKWGDDIVGVDEIKIIPTPYGMVIMCDAFSPFEIVAIEKTAVAAVTAAAETGGTLVVVSDGNGTVSLDGGEEAVGEAGNVEFKSSAETKTFKVTPNAGYEVDSVILGGKEDPIKVAPDGKFTVSGIDHNNVLSVTFIPKTVKADEAEFGEPVVAKVCQHPADKRQTTASKEPTCTVNGSTAEIKCNECGAVVQAATVIPATGHQNVQIYAQAESATCTTPGKTAKITCLTCNKVISEQSAVQALGHIFEDYKDKGNPTCKGQEMTAICERGCGATATAYNTDAAVNHSFTTKGDIVTEATCHANATAKYKCEWCDQTIVQEVPGTKLTHKNNGSGVCTLCGTNLCEAGHKWESHPEVKATCEMPGQTAYKECSVCGKIEGKIEIIPALGHDFGGSHTAGTKCKRCSVTLQSDKHTEEAIPSVAATCDTPGSTGGVRCSQCGDIIVQPTIVPAKGHDWDESNVEFIWATDGSPAAYVTLTCKNDQNHHLTLTAEVTPGQVTKQATCSETGIQEYSASVTLPGGQQKADTHHAVTIPKIPHTPKEGTVVETAATCTKLATKTYECSVCHETVFETSGELLPHNVTDLQEGSKLATCTVPGLAKGICHICHETVKVEIPATGHNYVNGVCTHCGAVKPSSTPSTPSAPSSGSSGGSKTQTSTGSDGSTTTTVTASDGSTTKTTTTVDGVVGTTRTDADGNVTSVEVIMPSAPETGDTVIAPVEVRAAASSEDAPEIDITVREGSARVEIPVVDVRPGTVAVIVDENGDETVVRDCVVDGNGVIITVDGSVTVKIVDRSVEFKDVRDANHWASDAVEFVVARDLFKGTGEGVFSPDVAMTRGMLVTVLYRLAYEPEAAGADMTFGDVSGSDYYADAVAWADDNDVVNGYTDGSFRPGEDVSREQLVTILYRYAKLKGYATGVDGNALASFTDVQNIQGYAVDAMNWAVSTGLVNGISTDTLSPQSGAKRAQVAAILERFCEKIVK